MITAHRHNVLSKQTALLETANCEAVVTFEIFLWLATLTEILDAKYFDWRQWLFYLKHGRPEISQSQKRSFSTSTKFQ